MRATKKRIVPSEMLDTIESTHTNHKSVLGLVCSKRHARNKDD